MLLKMLCYAIETERRRARCLAWVFRTDLQLQVCQKKFIIRLISSLQMLLDLDYSEKIELGLLIGLSISAVIGTGEFSM